MGSENVDVTSKVILDTCKKFGIVVDVENVIHGCRFYEFQCAVQNKTDAEKVVSLQTNLEYALSVHPIRIVVTREDSGNVYFSIEVPRSKEETSPLWSDVIQSSEYMADQNKLHVPIGVTVSGRKDSIDISKAKHLLIGGTTGSGKSNLIHVIINSLLQKNTQDELRLVLMDPKRVELTLYAPIPYLIEPVVTNTEEGLRVLEQLSSTLKERLVSSTDVLSKSPRIVIIIDELSDFMCAFPQEVENALVHIAEQGHTVGMHLILSTSRPSKDIYTQRIRKSIPTHIAGNTASQTDSKTILDMNGAEKLLGGGDMLIGVEDQKQLTRFQALLISNSDIEGSIKKALGIVPQLQKGPDPFPVPDSIFWKDYISEFHKDGKSHSGDLMQYRYKETSPDGEVTASAELWIEHGSILSPEGSNKIIFVTNSIFRRRGVIAGYYKRGWRRLGIPFCVTFVNVGKTNEGYTEWEVTAGYGTGSIWTILELNGEIISSEQNGSYIY